MNRLLKKMITAQNKYDGTICSVERELSDKVEFDFSIFWQPSDGFVFCDNNGNNSSFINCIEIIKEKGCLSFEDFREAGI